MKFKTLDYKTFIDKVNLELKNNVSKLEIYSDFTEPNDLIEVIVFHVRMKEFDIYIDNKKYDSGYGVLYLNEDYRNLVKRLCKEHFNKEPVFSVYMNSFWVRRDGELK